jgi:23S rRNA (cytidine1920-2'-O)/16S rRNA (cytidine1409-2'-O)-methyltransferase
MKVTKRGRARVDALLVERGLVASRAKAQAMVLAGEVYLGEQRVDKPGTTVPSDAPLRLVERRRFVSRGGDKLDHALTDLGLDVRDTIALDVGASTGGFTDCLLQRGATHVTAVDVGFGQLAQKLRDDPRVTVRERTNARELGADDVGPIDLVVVDASFIGIGVLMDAIARVSAPGTRLLALVKPQFEAGRLAASKGRGVIRDPVVREEAIDRARQAISSAGFVIEGEVDSRVHGPKGNVERFVLARRG